MKKMQTVVIIILWLELELSHVFSEQITKRSILNYPARCGVSKVSYRKATVMYKWEVQGLIKYLDYVKEFDETFIHETDHVKFTSPEDINGQWKFKIQSSKTQFDEIPYTFVSAKYTYEETPKNQRMNIGMKIKLVYGTLYSNANEFIITKPSDKFIQKVKTILNLVTPSKSTSGHIKSPSISNIANVNSVNSNSPRRVLPAWFSTSAASSSEENDEDADENDKPKPKKTNKVAVVPKSEKFVETNRVTVSFDTGNVQPLLENLGKNADNSNDENSGVDVTFIIDLYIPNDPIVTEQMKCYIGNFTYQLTAFGPPNKPTNTNMEVEGPMKNTTQVPVLIPVNKNKIDDPEAQPFVNHLNEIMTGTPPPFMGHLENIFMTGEFSDMVILVQGTNFPAHRVILANSSPYLAQMIRTSNNLAEFMPFDESVGQNETMEILRYIYTGHVLNLESQADKIILGAHQIGLSKLEKMCTSMLMNGINIENAIRMYSLAKDVDSEALTKAAVAVIRLNKQAVVSQSKEFQKLAAKYPAIIFDLFLS